MSTSSRAAELTPGATAVAAVSHNMASNFFRMFISINSLR
jgi:hypothetical protein